MSRWTPIVWSAIVLAARPAAAEDDSFVRDARRHVKAAQEARQAGNAVAALDALLQASALRPNHPAVALELAAGFAAAGRVDAAAATLRRVAAMGIPFQTEGREDLRACRDQPACAEALAAVASAGKPQARSAVAFTFRGPGLVPEGLAYEPGARAFFVSSVRERRVLRVDSSGTAHPFADRTSGLWSAFGLGVDPGRRRLWVATSALDETPGLADGEVGRAALVAFDLASAKVVARHELPRDRAHVVGDLAVTADGQVYATDSVSPAVYRVAGAAGLETIAAGEPLVSPQGVAVAADGKRLFVSDYAKGVFAIDLATRRVRLLEPPADAAMLGIDGLYVESATTLLAVQNGTQPARLLRLRLDGDRIAAVEPVDVGHPAMAEPTLGTMADGRFHYIANSQWDLLEKGGRMKDGATLQDPVILVLGK